MKYVIMITVLILASSVLSPQSIPAQTSQDLEWGLEIGTRLNYTYAMFDDGGLVAHVFYILEISSLPEIPDPLINESILENPMYLKFDENGTVPDGATYDLWWRMFPIGNWSLLSDYYENRYSDDVTIINDENSWGFFGFSPIGEYMFRVEIHCSKTDGVMIYANIQQYSGENLITTAIIERGWTDITTSTTTSTTTSITTNTDTSSSTTEGTASTQTDSKTAGQFLTTETLVLVFVSGGVIVLIVVVVFLKKK